MSDKTTIKFNGVDLTAGFVVSDLVRPFLMRTINTTTVDGRDGAIYRSSSYDAIDVKMRLSFESTDRNERVLAMANLVKALDVDEPAKLEISDDDGWYYLAIPAGGQIDRYIGADSFPLTFHCPDPRRYGEEHVVTVASGGSVRAGGNIDTEPVLEYTLTPTALLGGGYIAQIVIRSTSSGGREYPIYFIFSDNAQRNFKINLGTRESLVKKTSESSYSTAIPGVETEFPSFLGGKAYNIRVMSGTLSGSIKATYVDRWL